MLAKVCAFCEAHHLLPRGTRVLVACSGGPDSLALLDFLWQVQRQYQIAVLAAHFEHGIRGEASRQDARFVATFCQERAIPCFVDSAAVPQLAKARGESLEKTARDLRYAFLRRIMREQGCTRLALAHHADDQAETVLMRILRGTGTAGLAAMRPQSEDGERIRPFLCVTKQEILHYCRARKLQPRHDATNETPDALRNRLRLQLLPQLQQQYNPELVRALCQLSDIAADDAAFLQQQADRYWSDARFVRQEGGAWQLAQEPFRTLHPALQRVLLRRFWQGVTREGTDLGYVQAELLRHLLLTGTTGSRQELPHHYVATLAYGWLSCHRPAANAPVVPATELPLQAGTLRFGPYVLTAKQVTPVQIPEAVGKSCFYLPVAEMQGLVWRTRRPGDWISLPGGRQKIKKLLIDAKVPRQLRDVLPLLAMGSEILWVPEIRRSSRFRLDKRNPYNVYLQINVTC